jgi:hypothetical protein
MGGGGDARSAGWIPARIFRSSGRLMVEWCDFGQQRFTEPFFEQSVRRALRNPLRQQQPIEELAAFPAPALKPTAFVFHLSRCGSTLICQMLAAVARNIVISEAPPLDHVLQAGIDDPAVTRSQQIAWLRGLVRALGQPRNGETRLFIKWDSWHILQLPLIREAFPDVPWIFLYRDPVEVVVSHVRMRGSQVIPGAIDPRIFGPDWSTVPVLPLDEYCARVLGRLCEAALRYVPAYGGHLVNFCELPDAVIGSLARILGDYAAPEQRAMLDACQMNAKEPRLPYTDDRTDKQGAAGPEIRRIVNTWLNDAYANLEAIRSRQAPL